MDETEIYRNAERVRNHYLTNTRVREGARIYTNISRCRLINYHFDPVQGAAGTLINWYRVRILSGYTVHSICLSYSWRKERTMAGAQHDVAHTEILV